MGTSTRRIEAFDTREAVPSDVDGIALAHRDSIQSIGPAYYSDEVVAWWQEAIESQLYLKTIDGGEVFFIAVGDVDGRRAVLGFASDYCIEGQRHGTAVYVRGRSARQGIGSALLAKAEAHAIETGATSIEIEASLAGVDFYRAHGFIEVGRGETRPYDGALDGVRVHAQGAFSRHSLMQRTEIAICLLPARWRLRDCPPLPKL